MSSLFQIIDFLRNSISCLFTVNWKSKQLWKNTLSWDKFDWEISKMRTSKMVSQAVFSHTLRKSKSKSYQHRLALGLLLTPSVLSVSSKQCLELSVANFLVYYLIFMGYQIAFLPSLIQYRTQSLLLVDCPTFGGSADLDSFSTIKRNFF